MHAARTLLSFLLLSTLTASARASPRGSLELSAGAGVAIWVDGRREVLAMVGVSLPLDRLSAPPRIADEVPRARGKKQAKLEDEPKADAPAEHETREPSLLRYVPPPRVLSLELARATIRAAFRAAGRAEVADRYASLASRARASAALPELRLRAARTTDQSLRLAPTITDPYRYTQAGGVMLALEAQATWRLDRLVFANEEVRIEHLRRLRARSDARLAEEVLHALVAWQRALTQVARPDLLPEERAAAELRLLEEEIKLDLFTGGWFGERARAFRAKLGDDDSP